MSTYIWVIVSFLLPFAVFIFLPLWRIKKGEGNFILTMFAFFFLSSAICSSLIYLVLRHVLRAQNVNFFKSYLLALIFGMLTLAGWFIIKKYFRIR